jgi:hypothetical protein
MASRHHVAIALGIFCSLLLLSEAFKFSNEDYEQVLVATTKYLDFEVHDLFDDDKRDGPCYVKGLPYRSFLDDRFNDLVALAVGNRFIACDNFRCK